MITLSAHAPLTPISVSTTAPSSPHHPALGVEHWALDVQKDLLLAPPTPAAPCSTSLDTRHPSPIAPFPLHTLPPALRSLAESIAASTSTPPSYSATTSLALASAALGRGALLQDGERQIRPNLFVLLLTNPDPSFSTAFHLTFDALAFQQARCDTRWRHLAVPDFEREAQSLQLDRARILQSSAYDDESSRRRALHDVDDEIRRMNDRRRREPVLFVTEITRQRLLQRLAAQPNESLALINPDSRDVTSLLSGRRTARTALSESILLAGHTGHPLSTDTARERLYLYQPCLTALWSLDGNAAPSVFSAQALAGSQLLPRFLPLHVPTATEPLPSTLPTIDPALKKEWESTLKSLRYLRDSDTPAKFTCTPEAQQSLRDYENECRTRSRTDLADLPTYPTHWADHAWRLALLLHTTTHHASLASKPLSHPPHQSEPAPSAPTPASTSSESGALGVENNPLLPRSHPEPASPPANDPGGVSSDPSAETTSHLSPSQSGPDPASHDEETALPIPAQITTATATAAITLARWFADHQLALLAQGRRDLQSARDPIFARVVTSLRLAGGQLKLGQIKHRHHLDTLQIESLAARYPGTFHLTGEIQPPLGRPYRNLLLKSEPRSSPVHLVQEVPAFVSLPPAPAALRPPAQGCEPPASDPGFSHESAGSIGAGLLGGQTALSSLRVHLVHKVETSDDTSTPALTIPSTPIIPAPTERSLSSNDPGTVAPGGYGPDLRSSHDFACFAPFADPLPFRAFSCFSWTQSGSSVLPQSFSELCQNGIAPR